MSMTMDATDRGGQLHVSAFPIVSFSLWPLIHYKICDIFCVNIENITRRREDMLSE